GVTGEEVLEVRLPAGAEDLLIAEHPEALHRDEEQAEEQELEEEVIETGADGAAAVRDRLGLRAAEQQRDRGERDPGQAVDLRAQEDDARQAEEKGAGDDEEQQRADGAEVLLVERQRVVKDEEVGKEKTELAENGDRAEEAGGDPGSLPKVDRVESYRGDGRHWTAGV